jgi:hypothetical protein
VSREYNMTDKIHLNELKKIVLRQLTEKRVCPEGMDWCPVRKECVMLEQLDRGPNIRMKIIDFFKDNPRPPDKDVHSFAGELGIDEHKFEEHIYSILGDIFAYGRAKEKGFTEADADPNELKMGIEVEMEHTRCPLLAKRIAIDHLAEFPDYYTRLAKMEKEGEASKEESE